MKLDTPPADRPETLRETLRGILLRLALGTPDHREREARIEIMRKDGWL